MSFSVNTNVGAFVALQNLSQTSNDLSITQNRINTGLAVASTKDDSSTYAIAQNLRANVAGISAVKSSLDRGKSALDVAISAAESISDVLTQMEAKALAAADTGLDDDSRTSLAKDYESLRDQLVTLVDSATFNGTNLLKNGGQDVTALLSDQDSDTGTAGFQADVFTVSNQDLSLGAGADGTNVTLADDATFTDATTAADQLDKVKTSLTNVNTALSTMGSASRQLDAQLKFVAKLSDTIQTGIGNLVDADLARESARLQSLQVKQQLGIQALSIANQSPSAIISLFR